MKKLMILIITMMVVISNGKCVEASKIKDVEVNVTNATDRYIKMTIKNNRRSSIYPSQRFVLKKKVKGKWKKIHFKENVKFAKTIMILPGEKKVIKIKWKKYFGKNLRSGQYKIIFIRTTKFSL